MSLDDSFEPTRARTSTAAICSLICGILGCIPFLPGVAALVLGIVGIRKTRNPMVTGRGMAITGVVLGVLSVVSWTIVTIVFGAGIVLAFKVAEPARLAAEQFTRDLSRGQIDAALAVSPGGADRTALEALSKRMEPWGSFRGLGLTSVRMWETNGRAEFKIGGPATFVNETRSYSMTLRKVPDGYEVINFDFP